MSYQVIRRIYNDNGHLIDTRDEGTFERAADAWSLAEYLDDKAYAHHQNSRAFIFDTTTGTHAVMPLDLCQAYAEREGR